VVVSFTGGGKKSIRRKTTDLPQVTDKLVGVYRNHPVRPPKPLIGFL
jgi:hypothetical protein